MIFLLKTFKIAFKFTKNLKKESLFLSMALLSKISITISVAVSIVGLSLINGFEKEIKNKILNIMPHGEIKAINPPYFNWESDLIKIQKISGVINVFPFISFFAILEKNTKIKTTQIISIDFLSKNTINNLYNPDLIKKIIKLKNEKNGIILGYGIAKKLKVFSKDHITITIPINNINSKKIQFKKINLKIIDIFKLNSILDNQISYISLQNAQKYLKYKNGIDGFQIKVNDIFSIEKIINNFKIKTNQNTVFNSWRENYWYLYKDIKIIRIIIYLTMILLIVISCFSIIFILMITIKNKNIDIAILKTLGAKDIFIFFIFLWYGLIVSLIGYIIGIFIGILFLINIDKIIKFIEYFIRIKILPSNIYFINFIPFDIKYLDLFYILLITLILTLFSSLYPAIRSTKTNIIKTLNSLNE